MEQALFVTVVTLVVAVWKWITWKLGTHACLLYIAEKNLPMPSKEELDTSREKIIVNVCEDFFKRKKR